MSYTNSTTQASLHERERSPAEIARGRLNIVVNAVNNLFAFLPSEASTPTVERSSEAAPGSNNHNTTIAGEVVMTNEVPSYSQNDPVVSNSTANQTISYTAVNSDQDIEKIRSEVLANAVSSQEAGAMFRDPALEELIKC